MKKILLFLILQTLTLIVSAEGVCRFGPQASLYTCQFDGKRYFVLGFDEVKNKYSYLQDTVIIKFLFSNGKVMKLQGKRGDSKKVQASIDGEMGLSHQLSHFIYTYFVVFPISNEQIEMFKGIVTKAVVNTIPARYQLSDMGEEWTQKVYNGFKNLKDDFEF